MFESSISKKSIFNIVIFSIFIICINLIFSFFNQKNLLVFCNVGQGDAAYIRLKDGIDILVDAGPKREVLSCLGKYMPFYDRKIEVAILSHPQADHFGGFIEILNRYQIDHFIVVPIISESKNFKTLKEKLLKRKVKIKNFYYEEKINLSLKNKEIAKIIFFWPKKSFVSQNIIEKGVLFRENVLGIYHSILDLNDFSLIFLFSYGDFDVLFTGDASPRVLNLTEQLVADFFQKKIEVLKIPHHGSKNGLTKKFLELANPELSVISVGKKNPYGHPSKEILAILKALKKNYLRTDEKGDVVIEFNEKEWRVK